MGYELTRFISKISDHYCCSICKMVLEDPVQTPCEHVFCSECIKTCLKDNPSCPVDRTSLSFNDLKRAPRFFHNLLNDLEIRCDFELVGCEQSIKLEHLKSHLITCKHSPHSEVNCKRCNIKITRVESKSTCSYHLKKRLSCLDENIQKLVNVVYRKVEEISKLNDEVNRKYEDIRKLDEGITKLNDDVNHKDEEITELYDAVNLKDDEIVKLSFETDLQDSLRLKTNNFVENQARARGTDEEIVKLNVNANCKEEQITKLNHEVNRKDEEIIKLNNEVNQKDEEITKFIHEVIDNDEEIAKLNYEVHRRDEIMKINDEVNIRCILLEEIYKFHVD